MIRINIPNGAREIIEVLTCTGYEAFVVGGCVRDSLLNLNPHDWDICTNAKPDQVEACFPNNRIIETGMKHGTVTIVMDDESYEVTTYRIDGDYSDGRHPDHVEFTDDLIADLSRRDFTINAMAYSPTKGLIDPFDGQKDLETKRIKTVGNPEDRFSEDALRILRALRFSSVYGFHIEYLTSNAIINMQNSLEKISAERIQSELVKLLMGQDSFKILMLYSDVICTIIPEFGPCVGFEQNNRYHKYDVYEHIMQATQYYKGKDVTVKLALFLHDIAKPQCYTEDAEGHGHFYGHPTPSSEIANTILSRLKFDNKTREDVVQLIFYHDTKITPTTRSVRRMLNKIGEEQYRRLLNIQAADISAHAHIIGDDRFIRLGQVESIIDELIAQQQCFSLKDLAVKGRDIIEIGIPEGPKVGECLKYALNKVLDEELLNEYDVLISAIKEFLNNED